MTRLSKAVAVIAVVGSLAWVGSQVARYHHKSVALHAEVSSLRRAHALASGQEAAHVGAHASNLDFAGVDLKHSDLEEYRLERRHDHHRRDRRHRRHSAGEELDRLRRWELQEHDLEYEYSDLSDQEQQQEREDRVERRHRHRRHSEDDLGANAWNRWHGARRPGGHGHDEELDLEDERRESGSRRGSFRGRRNRRHSAENTKIAPVEESSTMTHEITNLEVMEREMIQPSNLARAEAEDAAEVPPMPALEDETERPSARRHRRGRRDEVEVHFREYENDGEYTAEEKAEWRRLRKEHRRLHCEAARAAGGFVAGAAFLGGVAHLRRLRREGRQAREAARAASAQGEASPVSYVNGTA